MLSQRKILPGAGGALDATAPPLQWGWFKMVGTHRPGVAGLHIWSSGYGAAHTVCCGKPPLGLKSVSDFGAATQ